MDLKLTKKMYQRIVVGNKEKKTEYNFFTLQRLWTKTLKKDSKNICYWCIYLITNLLEFTKRKK